MSVDEPISRLREQVARLESEPPAPVDVEREREEQRLVVAMSRLIAHRPRSVWEIEEALARRDVPAAMTGAVVGRLEDAGLLDDAEFARAWVASRRRIKGLGPRALRSELKRKGVDPRFVEPAIGTEGQSETAARALDLAQRKVDAMGDLPRRDMPRAARRLTGYLERKGYGETTVRRSVRSALLDRPR